MNVKEANFTDLVDKYYKKTGASTVLPALMSMIQFESKELTVLLRDYEIRPITKKSEIEFRQNTDELIEFFSILEFAIFSGIVEQPDMETGFWQHVLIVLDNPYVKNYYSELYPEYLAKGLRIRLINLHNKAYQQQNMVGAFPPQLVIEFFDIDNVFVRKLRRSTLLKLLDSFTIENIRVSDLVTHISTPEKYLSCLYDNGEKQHNVIHKATQDLEVFLGFTIKLKNLLNKVDEYSGLRNCIWLRYAYWFSGTNPAFTNGMKIILDTIGQWRLDTSNLSDELEDSLEREYSQHFRDLQAAFLSVLTKPTNIEEITKSLDEAFNKIQLNSLDSIHKK